MNVRPEGEVMGKHEENSVPTDLEDLLLEQEQLWVMHF